MFERIEVPKGVWIAEGYPPPSSAPSKNCYLRLKMCNFMPSGVCFWNLKDARSIGYRCMLIHHSMHLLVHRLLTEVLDYTLHYREVYLFKLLPVNSDFKCTQGILKLCIHFGGLCP